LKDPERLRAYLLERRGVQMPRNQGPAGAALETASEWFEVQDAVMEDPESASSRIEAFERSLAEAYEGHQRRLRELEAAHDEKPEAQTSRQVLESIAEGANILNYLNSLKRDVERLKTKLTRSA